MSVKELYQTWIKRKTTKSDSREKMTSRNISSGTLSSQNSVRMPPIRQRKITVVSIASNQHGLKIEGDQELRHRSISTIRLDKVISEIKEFHSRTEMQLRKSVRKQAKELGFFFAFFVVYIMFGAFLFFYIEECSGAYVPNDGSVPNRGPKSKIPEFENLTATCRGLYMLLVRDETTMQNSTISLFQNRSFEKFNASCQTTVTESVLPVLLEEQIMRNCTVNEFMLLKYAEFTIFTLLTIGYGNTTPATVIGRMCLIFYAVIGIPLAVTMYSVAGKLIVQIITLLIRMIQNRFFKLSKEIAYIQLKTLGVSVFFMITILLVGCSITTSEKMENLDFLSSFYFWFVSLTTIGYGDIHFEREKHLQHPYLLLLSAGNILFGLGIMAAIIEAFSLALEKKDLQMSTIIIDEEGLSQEEVELHKNNLGVALDRYRLNTMITERECETDVSSRDRDSESENDTINLNSYHNGYTNQSYAGDDGILLTDYVNTPDEHLGNGGRVQWNLPEPDVIRKF